MVVIGIITGVCLGLLLKSSWIVLSDRKKKIREVIETETQMSERKNKDVAKYGNENEDVIATRARQHNSETVFACVFNTEAYVVRFFSDSEKARNVGDILKIQRYLQRAYKECQDARLRSELILLIEIANTQNMAAYQDALNGFYERYSA